MPLFLFCFAPLWDTAFHANTERFQGLVPLLPQLCSLECPKGGGMWGIFRKPFKRAIWNTLGLHAGLATCLRFSSILDGVKGGGLFGFPTPPPLRTPKSFRTRAACSMH